MTDSELVKRLRQIKRPDYEGGGFRCCSWTQDTCEHVDEVLIAVPDVADRLEQLAGEVAEAREALKDMLAAIKQGRESDANACTNVACMFESLHAEVTALQNERERLVPVVEAARRMADGRDILPRDHFGYDEANEMWCCNICRTVAALAPDGSRRLEGSSE